MYNGKFYSDSVPSVHKKVKCHISAYLKGCVIVYKLITKDLRLILLAKMTSKHSYMRPIKIKSHKQSVHENPTYFK